MEEESDGSLSGADSPVRKAKVIVVIVGALFLGPTLVGGCLSGTAEAMPLDKEEEETLLKFGAACGPIEIYNMDAAPDDMKIYSGIEDYRIFRVDPTSIAVSANEQGRIILPIGDTLVTLILKPSVVQPMIDEKKRAPCDLYSQVPYIHFSGHAQEYSDSAARVTFDDFGMTAWIRLEDTEYFIDPIKIYDSNADDGLQIVYVSSDLKRNLEGIEDVISFVPDDAIQPDTETSAFLDEDDFLKELQDQKLAKDDVIPVEACDNSTDPNECMPMEPVIESDLLLSGSQSHIRIMRLLSVTDITFREENGRFAARIPVSCVNMVNGWYEQVGVQIQIVDTYDWNYDNSGVFYLDDMMDILRHEIREHTSYTGYDQCNLFTGHSLYLLGGYRKGLSYIRGAGTGLFDDASKTTYGFTITTMNHDYSFPEYEEVLAHELGHALNGVHDQTDPVFKTPAFPSECTLMGYAQEAYWHWFSDGSNTLNHMNSQRIEYWAKMNLHTVLWCMDGGVYSNYPSDNIKVDDLRVKVLDLPGPTDKVLLVEFYLTYYGPSSQITLTSVKTALKSPIGNTYYQGSEFGVVLKKDKPYFYSSTQVDWTLYYGGVWTVTPSYTYSGHTALFPTCSVEVKRLTVIAETAVVQTGVNSVNWHVDIDGMDNFYSSLPVKSWTFKLLAYDTPVRVGDEIFVYWGAYNANDETFYHSEQFRTYIACQRPDLVWDDFGHKYHTCWAHTSYYGAPGGGGWDDLNWLDEWNPGGGYSTFLASNTLTMSGVYRIIPDMYVDYTYSPWYDATVYLNVT